MFVAILPAAGKGMRMHSVTGGSSKELLPLGDSTVLDVVMDEALAAGATELVVIDAPDKPAIASHVGGRATVVTQTEQRGFGHAVSLAARALPTMLLLPDGAFHPGSPLPALMRQVQRGFDLAIAVESVSDEDVDKFGIVEWNAESGRISRILEKPAPAETASRWAIAARYAFSANFMLFMKEFVVANLPAAGELSMTPVFNAAISAGLLATAVPLEPDQVRYDCGDPDGYRLAAEVFSV